MAVIEQTHITTMMSSGADSRCRGSVAHFLSPGFQASPKKYKKKPHRINSFTELAHVDERALSKAGREEMSTDDT